MYAWNLLRAGADDADTLKTAIAAATKSVDQIRQAKRSDREDFRGTLPYHVLAQAKAAAGDYRQAIQLELEALELLSPDHFFLRGVFNTSLVDYYLATDLVDEARQVLTAAVNNLEQSDLPPELQFHLARAELDLAEFQLRYGEPEAKRASESH